MWVPDREDEARAGRAEYGAKFASTFKNMLFKPGAVESSDRCV